MTTDQYDCITELEPQPVREQVSGGFPGLVVKNEAYAGVIRIKDSRYKVEGYEFSDPWELSENGYMRKVSFLLWQDED